MPAAFRRTRTPEVPAADRENAPLDAVALQALAADFVDTHKPETVNRRGPFRPERLVSARVKQSGALAARFFRAGDVVTVLSLGLLTTGMALGWRLGQVPLRDLLPIAVAVAMSTWLFGVFGLYGFGRHERLGVHLSKVAACFAIALAPAYGLAWLMGAGVEAAVGLTVWFLLAPLSVQALHGWWFTTVRTWRNQGRLTPNVAIVGATKHAERLISAALARRDVNVIGVFDDRLARSPNALSGVPVLGDVQALVEHRVTPFVDRVVVAVDPGARGRVRDIVERLRVLPNEVSLLVDLETETCRDAALTKLADAPLTRLSGQPEDVRRAFSKRLLDVGVGALMLLMLSPLMAMIALWVKLDSQGPVLFRQKRHGFNNEIVTVWKFRTMRHESADPCASKQVVADDERVTRAGRFLRQMSLDELPQLINVLKGEMSLVGPRPHAVGMKTGQWESARLVAEYAWRHRMKPGMTGWAAIKGSRGPLHTAADVRRRVALDIEYIERQSVWLDLYCITMTVPVLVGDRLAIR
ncbi:MAG TPA: exopolysaccharide biosynthesis polyprenyl glycosylphosphotransferase [Caulobacteraceae bacterium]|jgi:Undecaprenyl-phosphate glucose phosphotransferase|nr:exopolysaccharide biosynthesis polyprenyl glycosylphosphotransferase [Caulobacteraceae bacterium]